MCYSPYDKTSLTCPSEVIVDLGLGLISLGKMYHLPPDQGTLEFLDIPSTMDLLVQGKVKQLWIIVENDDV